MVSADNGIRVTQAEFENLVRLRIAEAASLYYTAIETKLLYELADENVENLERVESVTKQAVQNGGRPAIEANRVRLDLIAAEQRRRTTEATAKSAVARLRAVMAIDNSDVDVTPGGDLGKSFDCTVLSIVEAFGLAQRARPDIISIQWQISKANSDIVVQQRAARPTVAPSFGYAHQYQEKAVGFPDANSWSAAVAVGLPVYDRNQGNISKANAELRKRQYHLRAALLDQVVVVAVIALFHHSITALDRYAFKATEHRGDMRRRQLGECTMLQVLHAEETRQQAPVAAAARHPPNGAADFRLDRTRHGFDLR